MSKIPFYISSILLSMLLTACESNAILQTSVMQSESNSSSEILISSPAEEGLEDAAKDSNEPDDSDTSMIALNIQIGEMNFSAKLFDNESTQALAAKMPLTLDMSELNGNEKYYFFSESFPAASQKIENIQAGDLLLYGSDCLVLFYEDYKTSYSYTRLGYIENPSGLAGALGNGEVQVIFSLAVSN